MLDVENSTVGDVVNEWMRAFVGGLGQSKAATAIHIAGYAKESCSDYYGLYLNGYLVCPMRCNH